MKVYIVKETSGNIEGADDLKIIKVQPEDEKAFLEEYQGRIIITGSSIQDVLIKFSQLLNDRSQ
jgi:hypothetical protein